MLVKFVTYNIQYGVGQDDRYDLSRTMAAVADDDIICLQEVTTHWSRCNGEDQPGDLAEGLNRYAVYASAYETDASFQGANGRIVNGRRGFGNMVLSRWPIVYSRPHSLPRPRSEVAPEFHPCVDFPRTALECVIDVEGRFLRVFSLHLSHLPGLQRQAQIAVLKRLVAGLPEEAALWPQDPRIAAWSEEAPAPPRPRGSLLFGDFNFEADDADYVLMQEPEAGLALLDAWSASDRRTGGPETSIENDGRHSRLDYLFVTEEFQDSIRSAVVDQEIKGSDHFPLRFQVEV